MSFTKVATIISTHGLKGTVKVFSEINSFKNLIINNSIKDKNNHIFEVESCSATNKKDVYLIQIKNVNYIDEAKKYINNELFADSENFKKSDEILVLDLLGLTVFCIMDAHQIEIGFVSEILNYGQGSMIEITSKTTNKKIPLVYPATFDFIEKINLKEKYLILKNYSSDIIL